MTPDEDYRDAAIRLTRTHRTDRALPHDLRFGIRLSFVRRFTWPPEAHRRLWPIMASADGRHWRTVAYGHSVFAGPFVFSWKTRR